MEEEVPFNSLSLYLKLSNFKSANNQLHEEFNPQSKERL